MNSSTHSKTDEAIVLRTRQYGESDLIVSLFTKGEGRLSGIAKGAKKSRKRFGSGLEIGSLIHLVYDELPQRELVILKEADRMERAPPWRSSWATITASSFALELAGKLLPERQCAENKFELLKEFLQNLSQENAQDWLLSFEYHWLTLSGWEPSLEVCSLCGAHLKKAQGWLQKQKIFDHYWQHLLTKPLASRPLLEEAFLV